VRIREVKTGSGKYAIQVVSKRDGKLSVHKHIGSYGNEVEKKALQQKVREFIDQTTGQRNLLDLANAINPEHIRITESRPVFAYELLRGIYDKIGFNRWEDSIIRDLVIARILSPASKRESHEVLTEQFGRDYSLRTVYRRLKVAMESNLKETFQNALIQFAKDGLNDPLKLVFYDVTTLYFESGTKGGLRDTGFSKEHRPLDSQIVVGLVVNRQGFPLYFDVFNGKTFEGHTFIPVIEQIRTLLGQAELVVVADAAMISQENIQQLHSKKIGFIVGARLGNLPRPMTDSISKELFGHDGHISTSSHKGYKLVCQFSAKRAVKDRSDREKQILRAQKAMASSKVARSPRFVKMIGKRYQLNDSLIAKAEKLEGIKGYLTNTPLPPSVVIDHYRNLWKIEHSFRITKSDLKARPIFHRIDETIKAHLIIVFAGLAISKYIEIYSGLTIRRALKIAQKVLTHTVTNPKTGLISFIETTIQDPSLRSQINSLKSLGH